MAEIKAIHLTTPEGFDIEFFKLLALPEFKTNEEAFNYLNNIYQQATGRPRYSDYNSYRVAKNRRLSKKT